MQTGTRRFGPGSVLSASVVDGEEMQTGTRRFGPGSGVKRKCSRWRGNANGHKIQRVRDKAVSLLYFRFEKIGSIKSVVS